MNKWKVAFWICFILLLSASSFAFYSILDQGITITYMREGYEDTEHDLNTLIALVNETDLSKGQIQEKMKGHPLFEYMDFSKGEVYMKRVTLIFTNERLERIEKQW